MLGGEPQAFELDVGGQAAGQHLLITYNPDVDDASGEVAGFYAMTLDISGRKRAELLLLLRSERRLQSITDSLPAMIAYVDRSETYRFANAQFRIMMGVNPHDLIGQTMLQFLGAAAHAQLQPEIAAALRGEHRKFERTGWKQNADTHFLVEYVPDIDADGQVAGFLIMVLDITDRKRMELALAQSEQRVRAITDNLPAMISHFDRDLRYTFANAKVGQLFGCDPAALIGQSMQELRDEHGFGVESSPAIRRAPAGEQAAWGTVTRDGDRPEHFEADYVPKFDATGQVIGFYALTFDVTRRNEREADLRASQKLLDRNGLIAGVGGWQMEIASNAVTWTLQTRRVHEVDDDYVPDVANAIDFYAGDGRMAIERAVASGIEHGAPWDLVLPVLTAKGRSIWVRATGEVEFEAGEPVRMLGAFQDVTQRVEQERQLREQAELLQVTLQSIGDGVITADERGCVRWLNPVAVRMTGWTSEAALGRQVAQVFRIVNADTRLPAPEPVALCLMTLGNPGSPGATC